MKPNRELFYCNLFITTLLLSALILTSAHFPLDTSLTEAPNETTRKTSRRIFKQNNTTYVKDALSSEIYYIGSDDASAIKKP